MIFKPKIYNTSHNGNGILGLKSFEEKIKTEVCNLENIHTKIYTFRVKISFEKMLKN